MLSDLDQLESESIEIFREVVASFEKPVMLYSIGKDSSVMLHIAKKAFYPGKIPFPLMHIDTGWKFKEMIQFRETIAKDHTMIIYKNEEGEKKGITPFNSPQYTDIMKTEALKAGLKKYSFDGVICGARRDEEASRAKERIFSVRSNHQTWKPKDQRPELWNLYNTKIQPGESMRIFPLSNWTELDIWRYIEQEKIKIVDLYFAKKRPVIEKNSMLILADDTRIQGKPIEKFVRFRTLGCYPLTAAIESNAVTVQDIIEEIKKTKYSERAGRLIDHDNSFSMERKKREGYF